jgi:hypothetical protein
MSYAVPVNAAPPKAITCDQACAESPVAEEGRSPSVLDRVLALAYGTFFLFLAVAGSLWILADLSAI